MRRLMILPVLLALTGSVQAAEEGKVLTGSKLRAAVSGKTVYLMTPIGAEIPVRYRPNGTIQGSVSPSLAALGGESVSSDTGRWWVVREQLCQKWRNWSDNRAHCYRFRQEGASVRWSRNDGESGTARIVSR